MKNKRTIFVIIFILLFVLYLYISLRGEYLQTLQVGKEYVEVFYQNLKYKISIMLCNFLIVFLSTYITTLFIKRGLKKFFTEEKMDMPKLPNKSLALIFGILTSLITSNFLLEKILPGIKNVWFGINDPVFGVDLGFYIFKQPLIETLFYYLIGLIIFISAYLIVYYLICFNKYFKNGVNVETLKNNTFVKQLLINLTIIFVLISVLTIVNVQNVVLDDFIEIKDGTKLVGAGITDITIKTWGNRIFAIIVLVSAVLTIIKMRQKSFRKVPMIIGTIPAYLVLMFIVMTGFNLIYAGNDKLDKEKNYINNNIKFTKKAYNIDIEEVEVDKNEDFSTAILNNKNVINNINIINEDAVLACLNEYQTNSGHYKFTSTKENVYNINGRNKLVYISPREIISNETRTFGNRTYEYTHGYGVVFSSATNTDENGKVEILQNGFEEEKLISIPEERIYFGLETNNAIIVNNNEEEYDYPNSNSTNITNSYNGQAGLNLNFLDRFILGLDENNLGIAFSSKNNKESKIITKRNIINRAKTIMPYLTYDEEPYLVITDSGDLVWVLDAYTVTNNYPYSQRISIERDGNKEDINYIRNSVKVLVDAYDGTIDFYITDKNDPIVIAYRNLYPTLFKDYEKLPDEIKAHFIYPEYLFNIQSNILKMYHDTQADVLYRADDIWDIAKENTLSLSAITGTYIDPYYTMLKTIESNEQFGLIVPYTVTGKQSIISYLVGTNDGLKMYKFSSDSAILGTIQLENLIEEDETISTELRKLDVTGSKMIKNTIVVPIDNTLLYVVPIYQVMLNEKSQIPTLKKVVVACENKIAIGDNLDSAIENLLSQEAVSFEVKTTDDVAGLIKEIINANENLKNSSKTNNWEMFGKDLSNLQDLISQLEIMTKEDKDEEEIQEDKVIENVLITE